MQIPEAFIEELIARIDIVELINHYVPLRKAGTNYVACCPFHTEKTPSFNVSQRLQRFHCFGCGASGDAIHFVRQFQHVEFVDSVKILADHAGLAIPQSAAVQSKFAKYRDLYQINQLACTYFQQELANARNGEAQQYVRTRGLTRGIVKRYVVGFAPQTWDGLLNHLRNQQIADAEMTTLGLLSRNEQGKIYDRFRNRLMFPIRDKRGQVLGFGGRALDDSLPKYLNSPQTPVFHKSEVLYGIYEMMQAGGKQNTIIVVEGYLDVVSLAQMGITNAVATLGTALTPAHVKKLYRDAEHLIFCFDGDLAGRNAAWKGLTAALPHLSEGQRASFLFLPDGHDPDSMVRAEGADAFRARLQTALDASQYLFSHLKADVDLDTIEGRSQLIKRVTPLIESVPSPVVQDMLYEQLALYTRTSSQTMKAHQQSPQPGKSTTTSTKLKPRTPVQVAIMLLLKHPDYALLPLDLTALTHSTQKGVPLLITLIEFLQRETGLSGEDVVESWAETKEGPILAKLAKMVLMIPEDVHQMEFLAAIDHIIGLNPEQEVNHLFKKLSSVGLTPEEQQHLQQLLRNRRQDPLSN
jgi:DNA primase